MDGTIIAKFSLCMNAIFDYRMDFDEIDGKINLIYELLSYRKCTGHTALISDIW